MVFGSRAFKANAGLPGWLNNSGAVCPLTKSTKILGVHIDDNMNFNDLIFLTLDVSLLLTSGVLVVLTHGVLF